MDNEDLNELLFTIQSTLYNNSKFWWMKEIRKRPLYFFKKWFQFSILGKRSDPKDLMCGLHLGLLYYHMMSLNIEDMPIYLGSENVFERMLAKKRLTEGDDNE